jgi:hypothetical protein
VEGIALNVKAKVPGFGSEKMVSRALAATRSALSAKLV